MVYAEFVISIIEGMKRNGVEPLCFVEERLDFSISFRRASALGI